MRILFCNKYNYPFSGTEVYLFEAMELLRSRGHRGGAVFHGRSAGQSYAVRSPLHAPRRFQAAQWMVREGETGRACDLLPRGAAADSGDDRGFPSGCGTRAEYLSPFVAVDLVGVEGAEGSGRLPLERLQGAVRQLQPGVARRSLRGLQGRRILACAEGEVLSGMGRADDAGGGGLPPQMGGHVRKMRGLLSCAQPICAGQVCRTRMGSGEVRGASRTFSRSGRRRSATRRTLRCFISGDCRRKRA